MDTVYDKWTTNNGRMTILWGTESMLPPWEPNMVWRRALPKIQQTVVRPKRNIARHIEETKTQIKDSNDSWSS